MKMILNVRFFVSLALFAAISLLAEFSHAQTQKLPIPSGVCTVNGQVLTAVDNGNSVQCASAVGATTSLTVGSGTAITKIVVYSVAVTPSSVATKVCAEQSVTVTGITTSDALFINPPTISTSPGAVAVAVRVSAADVAAVTFCNTGPATATPATGTYKFVGFRS